MPEITITLSESEACHIRDLCQDDHRVCQTGLEHAKDGNIRHFYNAIDSLNILILDKLKDA